MAAQILKGFCRTSRTLPAFAKALTFVGATLSGIGKMMNAYLALAETIALDLSCRRHTFGSHCRRHS
jgi:hypothetical protein